MPQGRLAGELSQEVCSYHNQAFAVSTKNTYSTHRNTFLHFCAFMGVPSVPASSRTICLYAAFLACTHKFSSIQNYLNIIGIIHKEFCLPNPLKENWHLSSLLTGIKRVKGNLVKQKLPITVNILLHIHEYLNLSSSVNASFWAICLVAFFGMFRKSHLLAKTEKSFDPKKQFVRSDFEFCPWGALVKVRWSKTIQFRERTILIPLPRVAGSPLCPVGAILHAFSFSPKAGLDDQAFVWVDPVKLIPQSFTYNLFMSKLREVLHSAALSGADFGTHSFRRGGPPLLFNLASLWN